MQNLPSQVRVESSGGALIKKLAHPEPIFLRPAGRPPAPPATFAGLRRPLTMARPQYFGTRESCRVRARHGAPFFLKCVAQPCFGHILLRQLVAPVRRLEQVLRNERVSFFSSFVPPSVVPHLAANRVKYESGSH